MKKVRFYDHTHDFRKMEDKECHSPRPFMDSINAPMHLTSYENVIQNNCDALEKYEMSNSVPQCSTDKTTISHNPQFVPSNDLELSMLDSSYHEPRQHTIRKSVQPNCHNYMFNVDKTYEIPSKENILSSIENVDVLECRVAKDNNFFIRKGDVVHANIRETNTVNKLFSQLNVDKENYLRPSKTEQSFGSHSNMTKYSNKMDCNSEPKKIKTCICYCSQKSIGNCNSPSPVVSINSKTNCCFVPKSCCAVQCFTCLSKSQSNDPRQNHIKVNQQVMYETLMPPMNAIERKVSAIEKYEKSKHVDDQSLISNNIVVKEKREPTVADLFKIIKLQNEQLKLLQDKVDSFISCSNKARIQQEALPAPFEQKQNIESEHQKISIGVMTSFEMFRTSTVINKEVNHNNNQNATVQCNRSQISIKEVSFQQPTNQNFLDGIHPVDNIANYKNKQYYESKNEKVMEEKTLNEFSLCNVQVANSTTPLLTPEQTMYLDVKDYSISDSGSEDYHSNTGWTYYNKVMTHVNGMLHDSDLPSSASALFRNMRQQCVQMQIDKTNFSVTKRVQFGNETTSKRVEVQQPVLSNSTDTSMKMNQLAAKYLGKVQPRQATQQAVAATTEMSFATRNYMERHHLLQGTPQERSPTLEMPRFLDIIALKQQPKLL